MQFDLILIAVGLAGITVGTITDIQKREVADWINYALLFSGLGLRILHSATTANPAYIIAGVIGAATMFGVALLMYYTGQWGGGDAKMLFGLGAIFATFTPVMASPYFGDELLFGQWWHTISAMVDGATLLFLPTLFINILMAGAIYGILWSIVQAIIHRRTWIPEYYELARTSRKQRIIGYALFIIASIMFFTADDLFKPIALAIMILSIVFIHVKNIIKAVEKAGMVQQMPIDKLTEGEWVLDTITTNPKKNTEKNTVVADAGQTITEEHLAQLDRTPAQQVQVKYWSYCIPVKKTIPIYEFEEGMMLLSPVNTPQGIIPPGIVKGKVYDNLLAVMRLKIIEHARTVTRAPRNTREKLHTQLSATKGIRVHIADLRVGDKILEPLLKDTTTIIGANNLGIDRYQIAMLKQYHTGNVTVKIGIPFLPAFLVGFLITISIGNPLLLLFL